MATLNPGRSLRARLFLSMALLSILPLALFASVAIELSSSSMREKASDYSNDIFEQVSINISGKVEQAEKLSFTLAVNPSAQRLLSRLNDSQASSAATLLAIQEIQKIIAPEVLYNREVTGTYFTSNDRKTAFIDKTGSRMRLPSDFEKLMSEAKGAPVWYVDKENEHTLLQGRQINDLHRFESLGFVFFRYSEFFLDEPLSGASQLFKGPTLMIDANGANIMNDTRPIHFADDLLEQILSQNEFAIKNTHQGEREVLLASSAPLTNGWRLIAAIPAKSLFSDITRLKLTVLVLMIFAAVAVVGVAAYATESLLAPLKSLRKSIDSFSKGELQSRASYLNQDEIGDLSRSFNGMAESIGDLIKGIAREEDLKRKYKLQLLQMQINPHFLYNTLDTLNWLARKAGILSISEISTSLGKLLRGAIGSSEKVTLAHEIRLLKSYINIQKYRYQSLFLDVSCVQSEVERYLVPILLIQPLAENSLIHGLSGLDSPLTIAVSARKNGHRLRLSVKDDGVGMAMSEGVGRFWNDREGVEKRGIGLANIRERLVALYGSDCCFNIKSEIGSGTEVIIEIPLENSAE